MLVQHHQIAALKNCDSYQYRQLIDQPTLITQLTSSIIDLFLTNLPWNFSDSGVTDIGISEHCLVYAIRNICIPKSNPKTVTSRRFKNFNPDSFSSPWVTPELKKSNFSERQAQKVSLNVPDRWQLDLLQTHKE